MTTCRPPDHSAPSRSLGCLSTFYAPIPPDYLATSWLLVTVLAIRCCLDLSAPSGPLRGLLATHRIFGHSTPPGHSVSFQLLKNPWPYAVILAVYSPEDHSAPSWIPDDPWPIRLSWAFDTLLATRPVSQVWRTHMDWTALG